MTLCLVLALLMLLSACSSSTPAAAPANGSADFDPEIEFSKAPIEGNDVAPVDTPDMGVGSFEPDKGEAPETTSGAPDFGIHFNKEPIEAGQVETIAPIEIHIGPYEFPEITPTPVKPIDPITFDPIEFKHSITDIVEPEEAEKIEQMPEEEIIEIAETQDSLQQTLQNELDKLNIGARVDPVTGEVSLDATVLFGGDSAELSEQGKEFLKLFTWTYSAIVTHEDYEGFLSKIQVEGHTAPLSTSTYESGLPLSQARADAVRDFCLSDECELPEDQRSELASLLEAVGLSNSRPVTDANGEVDLDACRRVSFRFFINLD